MDASQQTHNASVNDDLDSMQVQQVGPPEWRSVLNFSHDLGYPDFFPSRPGFHQPEDVVTPVNVRQGFQGTNVVAAGVESVSVHAAISDRLKKQNIFKNVDALAMEILNARRDKAPKFPESTYKLPNRVVYNETMKKSFLNDLADEGIPLNSPKFAKSVPHGMKGQDLLEMLWTRRIKVDRAVWLVQIIGAHDVQNLRKAYDPAKSPFAPNQQYSITFTEAIVGYLSKQLAELPFAHSKMETGKALANSETFRKQLWVEKWDYTQDLLETLFGRQLLDVRTFGMWLRDSLQDVPFAQLPFVLDQLARSAALVYGDLMVGTCIVAAAVSRLYEVVKHRSRSALQTIERRLVESIKAAWHKDPRMFFFPHHWRNYENLLRAILPLSGGSDDMRQFQAVRARNLRALCYRRQPNLGVSVLEKARNEALVGLQHLESYHPSHRLDKLCATFFIPGNQEVSVETLRGKLNVLLDWGIKRYRIFPHRPYLVAALVKQVLIQPGLRRALNGNWIESHMWTWIDQACETTTGDMAAAARTLAAEFFNCGILSFGNYLERMIALGRTFRQATLANNVGKYLDFVTSLSLVNLPHSVITLRRNIVHGFQIEETLQDRDRPLQQALTCYLNQAQEPPTRDLKECAIRDVPPILLDDMNHAAFAQGCRGLSEFRPSTTPLVPSNATLRLYLLIHLLERRGDYRLLLELLQLHWRKLGRSSPKAIGDAIERHRLLISCFRDEDPELYTASCHLGKEPWGVGLVLWGLAHDMDKEVDRKDRSDGIGDSDILKSLRLASGTSLDVKTISSLWSLSLEVGALQPSKEARADAISRMSHYWLNIAFTSLSAWKAYLDYWTSDADPMTAKYDATSAMCVELVANGAMEAEFVREKLVYPFLKSPSQVYQNRNHLQTVAALCSRLLVVDSAPGNMQDLMLRSAVKANFVRIACGHPSAVVSFLQRLPSMLLVMEDASLSSRTNDVSAIATSTSIQSLAKQYEHKAKQAFSAAVADMPEKRSFWTSTLGLLFNGPKEAGSALGIASTDWTDLASYTLSPGNATGNAGGHLPLSHAKAIVNAACQLVMNGETSTWWRMCASPPAHELYILDIAACSLIDDLIAPQPVLARDALGQMECYLSVMEIARSGGFTADAIPLDEPAAMCDVLQGLLSRVESLRMPIPPELLRRLSSLMTSVICFASRSDVADIQLRLLRLMDSCALPNAEWAVDLALLHFQIMRPNKRSQFLVWLEGSLLKRQPAFQRSLSTNESNWETPPVICESSEYLPHRHSFARLTQPVNNGSLSLLQFGAVLTGDRVTSVNEDSPWSRFVSERDVGINPTGESFYLRNSVSGLSTLDEANLERQFDHAMDIDTPVTEVVKKVVSTRPQPRKRVKVARDP